MHTKNVITSILTAVTFVLICSSTSASAINKCVLNGQTTFTDLPCPENAVTTPLTRQIIQPDDPEAAKQRYLSDQQNLHKINQEKIKNEKQQRREAGIAARQLKQNKDKEFKCKELDLKRKSALRQQANQPRKQSFKATEMALNRAKQAENKYAHYCGAE